MTVIKRAGRPPKETKPQEEPIITSEKKEPEIIHPVVQETKEPVKVEPVIRILEAKRAIPQLTQPNTQRVANGNVEVCDRKTGKCVSMSASYAAGYVKRNSKTAYIKK